MTHLCAICARRDASHRELLDGRYRPICTPCATDEVPEPVDDMPKSVPLARLLRAIRYQPGLTFTELRAVLAIPSTHEDHRTNDLYSQAVTRLSTTIGLVERRGARRPFTYWPKGDSR